MAEGNQGSGDDEQWTGVVFDLVLTGYNIKREGVIGLVVWFRPGVKDGVVFVWYLD